MKKIILLLVSITIIKEYKIGQITNKKYDTNKTTCSSYIKKNTDTEKTNNRCQGCCSKHGGITCIDKKIMCKDNSELSIRCQKKNCNCPK